MESTLIIDKIRKQMNDIISGKKDKVELVLTALLAKGHILLEDVPGVGKTTLANCLARSIDLSFGRIQFTPDTLPSDVTGISIYRPQTGEFYFNKGTIMNNIILADEINRTSPKTQASLLEAMEEGQVTVDGKMYTLDEPFMVIATQNPIDFLGTYNLPEAQLDRFLMRISIGYPDSEAEQRMAGDFLAGKRVNDLKPVATRKELLQMQEEVCGVSIHEDIVSYAVALIEATRKHGSLTLGASPRATLALLRAARASAYLDGRRFVIPEDIQKMAYPVLCHRFVLSMDAKMKKTTAEDVLKELLRNVLVPVMK